MSLSDFLQLMLADENLNKTDKEWLGNFLVESVEIGTPTEQVQNKKVDDSSDKFGNAIGNPLNSVLSINENLS